MRNKIINKLSQGLLLLATSAFIINIIVLLYGVVARYLIGHSPIWMDELSRYLIIVSVLLIAGPAWLQKKHMSVDFIEQMLPSKLIIVLRMYSWLLIVCLSGYMAWTSWHYAFSVSIFMTMGLGISKTIPFLSLPIGFGCLFIIVVLRGPQLKNNDDKSSKEIEC